MNKRHEMILEKVHPTGAEEWYCPTCGRRLLLEGSPVESMILIKNGDPHAQHIGSSQAEQEGGEIFDFELWESGLDGVDL